MIEKLVLAMSSNNLIEDSESEYMMYAMSLLFEKIVSIISILLIGICMNSFVEIILFLIFFSSLRKYTGGYHLNSFLKCYICSMIITIGIILFADYIVMKDAVMLSVVFVSEVVILMIGAVNHPNMQWDRNEEQQSRNRARFVEITEGMVIFFCILLGTSRKCV
ncbi:MAG: accessory gene regulator B family protein, partial [Lachnospiraceae bacterium]|nr:accessory gene regulator B family protein [Lachnospiraceae bacterium]